MDFYFIFYHEILEIIFSAKNNQLKRLNIYVLYYMYIICIINSKLYVKKCLFLLERKYNYKERYSDVLIPMKNSPPNIFVFNY